MDDYNDSWIFIFIIICLLIFILFSVSYFKLLRFKKCYDNSFKFNYCENYINY